MSPTCEKIGRGRQLMKKKYLGIREVCGTKGQHNDEVDISQEKSAHGKETLKSVKVSDKRKSVGMRLFGTKGQHNDEVDLSQEKSATKFRRALIRSIEDKSAHGKETLKSVELSVKRRESIEVRIKANGDSLVSSTSTIDPHEAKSRQLSHAEISLSKEEIQAIAKKLQSENLVLRKRLWRLQNRSTIPAGIILSSVGAASLLFSYLWNSLILTFIGLGIVLWGILIIYISSSRHVRAELLC